MIGVSVKIRRVVLAMRDLIAECHLKNKQRYGYSRVVIWLRREYGLIANHKSVLRIMNKYNMLSAIRRRRCFKRVLSDDLRYPNILKRNFEANRPNEKWATDITYIKTKEGVLFLSAIKDLYDNYIVGYKTSRFQDYNLVSRTILAAKAAAGTTDGVIIHSDQGYQYTSFAYKALT
jgi:putative transposase